MMLAQGMSELEGAPYWGLGTIPFDATQGEKHHQKQAKARQDQWPAHGKQQRR